MLRRHVLQMKSKAIQLLLLPVLACAAISCSSLHERWSFLPDSCPESPWARQISVAFSNAPLPSVAAEIEALANALPGREVTIRLLVLPSDSPDTASQLRVTLAASDITVGEALRIVAEVKTYGVVFKGGEAVVAPSGHADGSVLVTLQGSCKGPGIGDRIQRLSLICTRAAMMFDDEPTTTSVLDIVPNREGRYSALLRVSGYSNYVPVDTDPRTVSPSLSHPNPQKMRILAVAEGHYPICTDVELNSDSLRYDVNLNFQK
jgi:hypothetical protein